MQARLEELENEVNQRIALSQRLEELVITDSLTEVFNRRRFDELLRQEWRRWQRYKSQFGLILLDIDYFKNVNDTHGHLMGDAVLRQLAAVLGSRRISPVAADHGECRRRDTKDPFAWKRRRADSVRRRSSLPSQKGRA